MNRCAACQEAIGNEQYIKCQRCMQKYHNLCLNLDKNDIELLSPAFKKTWICPNCLCKQKKGDNSNDLVRPSTPTNQSEFAFNVTRRKTNKAESIASGRSSPVVFSDNNLSNIRDIVRVEMREVLREYMSDFNTSMSSRFSELSEQINEFKDSLNFLSTQFDKLNSDMSSNNSEIKQLRKENESLRQDVNNLSIRFCQLDQLSRATNLEIQCVPEFKTENVVSIVKQIATVTNMKIDDRDISYCSRVAKQNAVSGRPRNILVKFNTPRTRDSYLASVIKYNKDHPTDKLNTGHLGIALDPKLPVYVTDNLSPENKSLHAAARIRARELNYKFVWIRGGRIYLRKTESSETIFVRNIEVLNKL